MECRFRTQIPLVDKEALFSKADEPNSIFKGLHIRDMASDNVLSGNIYSYLFFRHGCTYRIGRAQS